MTQCAIDERLFLLSCYRVGLPTSEERFAVGGCPAKMLGSRDSVGVKIAIATRLRHTWGAGGEQERSSPRILMLVDFVCHITHTSSYFGVCFYVPVICQAWRSMS